MNMVQSTGCSFWVMEITKVNGGAMKARISDRKKNILDLKYNLSPWNKAPNTFKTSPGETREVRRREIIIAEI